MQLQKAGQEIWLTQVAHAGLCEACTSALNPYIGFPWRSLLLSVRRTLVCVIGGKSHRQLLAFRRLYSADMEFTRFDLRHTRGITGSVGKFEPCDSSAWRFNAPSPKLKNAEELLKPTMSRVSVCAFSATFETVDYGNLTAKAEKSVR